MTRPAPDTAHWINTLISRFPELLTSLAPGSRPSTTGRRAASVSPSLPVQLHISDALRDITDGVIELDEAVHERLGLGRPRRARVPQRLIRIASLLDAVAAHPDLAEHVRDEARRMARRCAHALGDSEAVLRLPGRCPRCDSVSLRAFPDRRAVLCVNPACRCGDGDCACGTDPAHRHIWQESQWAALAEHGIDGSVIRAALDTGAGGAAR
ncbi:hypothetical protein [Streptomyces yaizuensis]|uniref:Uncharacterized protein n=1 Tax=Streptomyces yaizuensis TaxID=2989713 RepID=A0ABQ5P5P1_9ACTN|nr:hypothetical protein [Streptomyces sp. YSPA8]GLF97551.1 hypothetical protein SYYSPA8_24660 [Streptomyces sp. YSPA8]